MSPLECRLCLRSHHHNRPNIQTILISVTHLAPRASERNWASIWFSQLNLKFSKDGLCFSLRIAPLDAKKNGCLKGRIQEGGGTPRGGGVSWPSESSAGTDAQTSLTWKIRQHPSTGQETVEGSEAVFPGLSAKPGFTHRMAFFSG